VNYEAGLRFKQNALKAEAIGFFTDYENLLGADTFSAGGGGALGDQFNGGGVHVSGLEAALRYDVSQLLANSSYRYPITATYTYTQTEFQSSFNSSFSEWGNVREGDELPYIPPHQLYISAGVEQDDWAASVGMKYTDQMRTVAGSGALTENNSTDSSTVFDLNGEVEVVEGARLFGTVHNLFEEEYIAAARPAGLRPGAPQIVFVGLKAAF
jgi:Fe(3+) dicitrate transport protein